MSYDRLMYLLTYIKNVSLYYTDHFDTYGLNDNA